MGNGPCVARLGEVGPVARPNAFPLPMSDKIVHPEPSSVDALDGHVQAKGPDEVDVRMTPEAAEETADRLTDQAVVARGQRRLRHLLHKPK